MTNTIVAPQQDCPKCGQHDAFSMFEPRYRASQALPYFEHMTSPPMTDECLEWTCLRCHYEITTPTADAKVPA
jgi:hypothetical protein